MNLIMTSIQDYAKNQERCTNNVLKLVSVSRTLKISEHALKRTSILNVFHTVLIISDARGSWLIGQMISGRIQDIKIEGKII